MGRWSYAFEGILNICRTGLWFAPLMLCDLYRDVECGALVMRTGTLEPGPTVAYKYKARALTNSEAL